MFTDFNSFEKHKEIVVPTYDDNACQFSPLYNRIWFPLV